MFVELSAKTDVGRIRSGNEDNYLVLDLGASRAWTASERGETPVELRRFEVGPKGAILAVSDGMGGALAGDVASRLAVETVRDALLDSFRDDSEPLNADDASLVEILRNATEFANDNIHRQSQDEPRYSGMGATFTGAAVTKEGIDFVQVGDSRAYVIRGNEIRLATKDQSLVQQLVDVGQISEQEAETHMFRNVILQALGAQSEITPVMGGVHCQGGPCRVHSGDTILLCSDGLSGKLRAEEMLQIVNSTGGDLAAACQRLIDEANARGGEDNITVILARVSGDDISSSDAHRITVQIPAFDNDNTMGGEEDTTQTP